MKIAILGTKGIPNNYGGYEQFAEYISVRLQERGHSVTVYNPSYHKFRDDYFKGVKIRRMFSPEGLLGGAANIIYDYLCLKDALSGDFDIIYEAGYHSVAPSYRWFKPKTGKKAVIITNMDGLEWKRSKWNRWIQLIIEKLEKIAVQESPFLISDNKGIQSYLKTKFNAESFYIPYGADPIHDFDRSYLSEFDIQEREYFILVARLEPENNVETIIKAHLSSDTTLPLLVVGNHATKFGRYLKSLYQSSRIRFLGGIYLKKRLDSIRHYSKIYFHGHSVGGTNPSLLEAMACQCFIVAHRNPFNESILESSAFYFDTKEDIQKVINDIDKIFDLNSKVMIANNLSKIESLYNWDIVVDQHEKLFVSLLADKKQ